MTLFPSISPVIERSRIQIQDAMDFVRRFLPDEIREEYRTNLARVQQGSIRLNSFVRWSLYHFCLYGGFLQARFTYCGQAVFTFGAEVLPWSDAVVEEGVPGLRVGQARKHLSHIRRSHQDRDRELQLEVILPEKIRRVGVNLIDYEILPLAVNHYFNVPTLQNRAVLDHVETLHNFTNQYIEQHLLQEIPVTITHFRFQDLSLYLETTGEHGARDFMDEIIATIKGNLKKTDFVYQMNPVSYIVLSPGAERHQMERRFKTIYFQIKSLVLEFKMYITTIEGSPIRIGEVWRELKL